MPQKAASCYLTGEKSGLGSPVVGGAAEGRGVPSGTFREGGQAQTRGFIARRAMERATPLRGCGATPANRDPGRHVGGTLLSRIPEMNQECPPPQTLFLAGLLWYLLGYEPGSFRPPREGIQRIPIGPEEASGRFLC